MELHHHFVVPSSVDDTWATFNNLELVAPCFPGATLTGVDGGEFTGTVKIKLGPISMMYGGVGKFVEQDESARRVVIEATGKDKRGNGTAGATVTAEMTASGDGTAVEVSTDMNVTGKPAQFGRGVIQDVSDKLLDRFIDCVKTKLPGADGGSSGDAADAAGGGGAAGGTGAAGTAAAAGGAAGGAAAAGGAHAASDPAPNSSNGSPATAPAGSPAASSPGSRGEGSDVSDDVQAARRPPSHTVPDPKPASSSAVHASEAAELDLGATVGPALLRRYGPALGIAAAATVLVVVLIRARRR